MSNYAKENIPAQKVKKKKKARLSGQNGYLQWTGCFKKKKSERQEKVNSLMLPKSKRLNLKKDFKWVASGEKIESNS